MLRYMTAVIFGAALALFAVSAWAAMSHQPGSAYFTDVSSSSPHNHEIGYLYESGVVNGFGDNTYAPDLPVTRQEMASYISRTEAMVFVLTFISVDWNFFGGYYTGQTAYQEGRISYDDYQRAQSALNWATEAADYEFGKMRDTDMEWVWNMYF